jgi:hypothetical protein
MNTETENKLTTFRYNLSLFYQSLLIYLVVFILYMIIRGEFVEDEFTLITNDPIIYFMGIVVLISVIGLFYNIYRKKHIEVTTDSISFITRFGIRSFTISEIKWVKISGIPGEKKALRIVQVKLKHNRRRPVIIRPHDYENESVLVKRFEELKVSVEKGLNN